MKREIIALFLLMLLVVVAILYTGTPTTSSVPDDSEINALKAQISGLEERIGTLEVDASQATQLYSQCQSDLEECKVTECSAKDLNYNAICKKLELGTMLRVNADRATDIVFQCITETETTYIFFSRPMNNTIQILDSAYNEVMSIVDCEI